MIRWLLYLPFDTITTLLAFPLSPIICLFADGKGDVTLSKKNILRMWLTPDNPIEGDKGHYERWAGFVEKHPKIGMYVQRVFWLWRNKAYGWSWYVFNCEIPADMKLYQWGNPEVSDKPYKPGYWIGLTSKNIFTCYWMLYVTFPTFPGKCFRAYLGWKMRSPLSWRLKKESNPDFVIKYYSAMYVSAINPWKTRK